MTALWLSLQVAGVATFVTFPIALGLAWLLARHDFYGKSALSAVVHLPLVLPPVVTGYLLLIAFGRQGPIGQFLEQSFGIVIAFRWTGAALAAGIMALPLMVRTMRLAIETVNMRLEAAAATLGAPRSVVFCTITWPLILPGVLAGTVMGFAKALGEFGATITFVAAIPGETQTLPSAIYSLLQVPGAEREAATLALIAALIAIFAVVASEWFARRLTHRTRQG